MKVRGSARQPGTYCPAALAWRRRVAGLLECAACRCRRHTTSRSLGEQEGQGPGHTAGQRVRTAGPRLTAKARLIPRPGHAQGEQEVQGQWPGLVQDVPRPEFRCRTRGGRYVPTALQTSGTRLHGMRGMRAFRYLPGGSCWWPRRARKGVEDMPWRALAGRGDLG